MANPKVVVDAFLPDLPAPIAGIQLRPVSIAAFLVLEKIGSPLAGGSAAPATPPDPLDAVRGIYVLSRTDAELEAIFRGFSRPEFDRAVWEFATRIPAAATGALVVGMLQLLGIATSTIISAGADEAEPTADDSKKKPLGTISGAKAKQTASAGS